MKTKMKMPIQATLLSAIITALFSAVTPVTAHASGSYVSPNALLKKKPAAEPTPTPAPEAKKKK
jgi:hypothetical protein